MRKRKTLLPGTRFLAYRFKVERVHVHDIRLDVLAHSARDFF
jgi:hypothetical protein